MCVDDVFEFGEEKYFFGDNFTYVIYEVSM